MSDPIQTAPAASPAATTPLPPLSLGIAYVFLIFLGAIGIHKFYQGKVGMGILYIFTAGIAGIGIIIDLFTLPKQIRVVNARRAVGIK